MAECPTKNVETSNHPSKDDGAIGSYSGQTLAIPRSVCMDGWMDGRTYVPMYRYVGMQVGR